jgi:hypothetical protein
MNKAEHYRLMMYNNGMFENNGVCIMKKTSIPKHRGGLENN